MDANLLRLYKMGLEANVNAASRKLHTFPKGPMGLTPDTVKSTPEYRAAKQEYARAFEALRAFNTRHVQTRNLGQDPQVVPDRQA